MGMATRTKKAFRTGCSLTDEIWRYIFEDGGGRLHDVRAEIEVEVSNYETLKLSNGRTL